MNKIPIVIAVLLAVSVWPSRGAEPERVWYVTNESRLAINGESNVNEFRCEVDRYYNADNLHLYSSGHSDYQFSDNRIIINLMEFDCGRRLITRDFRESLNAERDPEMVITFISLSDLPDKTNGISLSARLKVTIAGVTREFEVLFTAGNQGNGVTHLNGTQKFLFSDFGLAPPSKMLGMINVKNEVEVTFDLMLEEISERFQAGRDS